MRNFFWPILFFLILLLAEGIAVLTLNDGHFSYSLDDAYIHLALSQRIYQGHYGINISEASAPSSSILWPLLLAPFSQASWFIFTPLIINILCGLFILLFCWRFFFQLFGASPRPWLALALTILIIPTFNMMGLIFSGMEHLLQTLLVLLTVIGLIKGQSRLSEGCGFYIGAVLGPLVRYENLTITFIAILWLVMKKRYRRAVLTTLAVILPIIGFSLFLHSQQLGWLPASIIAKSVQTFGGNNSLAINTMTNIEQRQAIALLLGLAFMLIPAISRPADRTLALFAFLTVCGHMIFGQFGWADRYEIYIIAFISLLLTFSYKTFLQTQKLWLPVLTWLILIAPYLQNWLFTPLGCNNIYEQQHQMARFAQEYVQAPVAVNDLGCVAFNNKHHVLDLWGLASPEVLKLKRQRPAFLWMDSLAHRHKVQAVMIYDAYYPVLPAQWTCVGKLFLGRRKITTDQHVVSFYTLEPATAVAMQKKLVLFSQTLPAGVRLETRPYNL